LCRTRRPSSSRRASSGRPSTRSDEKPRRGRTPASPPSSFSRFRHACRVGWEGESRRGSTSAWNTTSGRSRGDAARAVARDEGREPSSPRRSVCRSVSARAFWGPAATCCDRGQPRTGSRVPRCRRARFHARRVRAGRRADVAGRPAQSREHGRDHDHARPLDRSALRRSHRVMYLGRIVEGGTARDVVRNPQHPHTKSFSPWFASAIPEIARPPRS
jgi:hypothetical protein